MKKLLPVFSLLWLIIASILIVRCQKTAAVPVRIPGGQQEENREVREAWQRMRLADPATGEIPIGVGWQERQFAAHLPQALQDRSGPDWLARGPWNVGGRTRALAIDVTDREPAAGRWRFRRRVAE